MSSPIRLNNQELFSAQNKAQRIMSALEEARQERTERGAALRAQRLAKKAADKAAAGEVVEE